MPAIKNRQEVIVETTDSVSRQEDLLEAEVASDLEEAKQFAKSLSTDDVNSGQWFLALLQKVVQTYDRNARAEYLQQKYPGLSPDEIADILTSVTVRYATIAGALTGAAATANMIATLSSVGMTAALLVGALGAEMLYLARIQMRLVLDLTVVYDLHLDPEDPEDILMIFGYALGIAPAEMLGKGLAKVAAGGTRYAVKKYVSKGTLKAIQDFARRLGIRILQRTIIKYTVPVASAVVGSSYNYVTTKSLARIAKSHLKNRGKVTDELRLLVSRQNTYDIAFPAAAMYMAQVDGRYSAKEKEFYRALLSRMSFDEHTQAEFRGLLASEDDLLAAISKIEDDEMRSSLVEVLVLMAVYDGELVEQECAFLTTTAAHLNVPLDLGEVEQQALDYRVIVEKSVLQRTTAAARDTASRAVDVAGQAAETVRETASIATGKAAGAIGKVLERKRAEKSGVACTSCGSEVPADYAFCPNCGQSMATDKHCKSCDETIPIDATFCPRCGAPQG
jgi:RNA polymerase subunit RPABC4/transcription elongation factor Spt4/tellurite resistance protein